MMISNKSTWYGMFVVLILFTVCNSAVLAQYTISDPAKLKELEKAVEADPENSEAHWAYIRARDFESPELINQYEIWIKKYPKNPVFPYMIGEVLSRKVNIRAREFLLKALAIDSNYDEAWKAMATDAENRGDFKGYRTYLEKAKNAAPENADYAFQYASSFSAVDNEKYKQLSIDFIREFPKHERAAQALYWLADKAKDINEKVKYYDWMRSAYPVNDYDWSESGMEEYFDFLLFSDTDKAISLAGEMTKVVKMEKQWIPLMEMAKSVNEAKRLMNQNKGYEALKTLNSLKLPKYFSPRRELLIWKAKACDISGQTKDAYDTLMIAFAKAPSPRMKTELFVYGKKLGKSETTVSRDLWQQIESFAQPATDFKLKNYLTSGHTSLSDNKGKVIFITYWYPACGPCRGEFPHFENIVRKFKGQDLVYWGINIYPKQSGFIAPFVQRSGYSFVPLEDVDGREKGNLDNRGMAPVNFLIDRKGRVVFSGFKTNGNNEDELELMISMLLEEQKG